MLIALAATVALAAAAQAPFPDPGAWKPHSDGGRTVEVADAGPGALRLRYVDAPPHWGNVVAPVTVPPKALALRFALQKHASAPEAAMHIWLMEPDGDAWVSQVRVSGRSVGELRGRHDIALPVGGFAFEARGPGTRQMPTADRMLLGCNYGDLEVTVSNLRWEQAAAPGIAPLPRAANAQPGAGRMGRVAVLDMGSALPDGFQTAHPPARMAEALRRVGYAVAVLKAGDLADPDTLTPARFDAVVLTAGPYFPLRAREAFVAYLKAGGSFLSTDGFAFDRLLEWDGKAWRDALTGITAAETAAPVSAGAMNMRSGRAGDAVTFGPDQVGVFDPMFRISGGATLRTTKTGSGRSAVLARAPAGKPLAGYAAAGLLGDNNPVFPPVYRRWDSLLDVFDADGRNLGPGLAVMHNHAGTFRGSAWAFSGLGSGADLFLGTPARRALLAQVMERLTRRVFLHSLAADLALYEPGETARVRVEVANHGRTAFKGRVTITCAGRAAAEQAVTLRPGESRTVSAEVRVTAAMGDLCRMAASLSPAPGWADRLEGAFCVRSARVVAAGPRVAWRDNYLTVDGRARFLVGTNQTGAMFYSAAEGPAVWDRDFAAMRRHGVHLLRILHFSPFAARGYQGDGAHKSTELVNPPKRLLRQMDAIAQLAQKHRVAIMLTLHDWLNVALTDEELRAQHDWNRLWAARYRDVPGILYDVQNEPTVDVPDRPDVVALWNTWLTERYGTDEALRAAWHVSPPERPLPEVPLAGGTGDWHDARTADRKRFETVLLNRWVKANVDGVKAGDPDAAVTVGYLPSMPPADKMLGQRHTDFANMHFYGPLRAFPLEIKLTDRGFDGKGFSVGEFGAQEAHDARAAGRDDLAVETSIRRFSHVVHYTAGLGGAFVANWSWKEMDEMVFPWGLLHRNAGIAKPWMVTYSQEALFLSLMEPVYSERRVYLLAPDKHRIGPRFNELHAALQRSVDLLLDQRVDFGVINEESLARLPSGVTALLWPLPYLPPPDVLERVAAWVRAGGTLYLSGDVAFDAGRRPARRDQRALLGLDPGPAPVPPFGPAGAAPPAPLIEVALGAGRVLYAPYPLELRPGLEAGAAYGRALAAAGIAGTPLEPRDASVHVLTTPLRAGGRLITLVRHDEEEGLRRVRLPACGVALDLAPGACAFVALNAAGEVTAAESSGALEVRGALLARAAGHFGLSALDGLPLARSRQVLALPHHAGGLAIPGLAGVRRGEAWVGGLTLSRGRTVDAASQVRVPVGDIAILAAPGALSAARKAVARAQSIALP